MAPVKKIILRLAAAAALAILTGCAPNSPKGEFQENIWPPTNQVSGGWKRIIVRDYFSFEAPTDTQQIALQGIDSFVGGYNSKNFVLTFDYGAYSNSLSESTPWISIDGHKARMEFYRGDCESQPGDHPNMKDGGAVHVPLRSPPDRLSLTMFACAKGASGEEELQRLFLSLRFNPEVAKPKKKRFYW